MPIEIKELHIRVAVNSPQSGQSANSSSSSSAVSNAVRGSNDKEAIVAECVEQVLQMLQNKMER
jgi:hypothetical protein